LHPGLRSAFWLHTKRYTKARAKTKNKKDVKEEFMGLNGSKTNFFLSASYRKELVQKI
jgi:hypothetical protein